MSDGHRTTAYDRVHVVVPAHDEEDLLPACLDSVAGAVAHLVRTHPHVRTSVTVVADRCSDATALVAARAGTDVVETTAGCVGLARRTGVERAVALGAGAHQRRVWVANTDADTVVPEHWLTRQLDLAAEGFAMVVGAVRPDRQGLDARRWRAWHERHRLQEGHPHVHGANLGLSLDACLQVGGFPAVPLHEDALLVEAVRCAGFPWIATSTTAVTTSARRRGRLSGGFADYLDGLT
ncbi:glycosyltransferase [Nocardioides sp. MAHUQ-72]|uniref:glycosyltransferase n=1 Tax=unclassified Nocardioides TaxID=2615069 RepID=UPI003606ED5C